MELMVTEYREVATGNRYRVSWKQDTEGNVYEIVQTLMS